MRCECRKYLYSIYCSIKRKLASGTRSWNGTQSTDGTSTFYCAVLHLAALRKCRTFVHYDCSGDVFIKISSCLFCFFGKIYSPFCLQNCLFLFTAYYVKNSASKFCQGLEVRNLHDESGYISKFMYGKT